MVRVSIIIPNYNGKELLVKNLPKVIEAANGAEIIVVDDASTDGSVEHLIKNFPNITVVKKPKNEGFASTVNTGVTRAHGDIVVLLNTDVVPQKGFLKPLLSHFKDKEVFAVGCMDESVEGKKTVKRGRGVGFFKKGFLVHERGEIGKTDTLWVSGGSGAFCKSLWDELNGMDELYNPFYWDDIDLSYRAQKVGYKVLFEPKSTVIHLHEEGIIKTKYSDFAIKKIAYRNQFIFIWKNITDKLFVAQHIFWLPYHMINALVRADFVFFAGLVTALLQLPYVFVKRHRLKKLWKKTDREILQKFS